MANKKRIRYMACLDEGRKRVEPSGSSLLSE